MSRNPAEEAIQTPAPSHTPLKWDVLDFAKRCRHETINTELSSHLPVCKATSSNLLQETLRFDNRHEGWTDVKCCWCFLLSLILVTMHCNICIKCRFKLNHKQPFFSWRNCYQNIYHTYNTSNVLLCQNQGRFST